MPHRTHRTDLHRRLPHPQEWLGLHRLPRSAADLVLLGDLTGRYAAGSYSRTSSDGRTLTLRSDRQGAAEHGHRITAAIACHVARAGGTVDELTHLLLHPEHEGGRHARHLALRSGHSRALDYVRRVWASASAAVNDSSRVESRHDAYEILAALRDRIETTPWRGARGRTALRVLRTHLNFAEIAGGLLHHASERQTAEEAGISRTTLRAVYQTVLKPRGWLRRLRVGHGREGSIAPAIVPSTFRRALHSAAASYLSGPVTDLFPHLLRHACATHNYERGMTLWEVQKVLGHAWATTTLRYMATAQADPEHANLEASSLAAQRLVMDRGT
ncbi:tyrosine-type recombinase/integrase [Streptomyces tauricus]